MHLKTDLTKSVVDDKFLGINLLSGSPLQSLRSPMWCFLITPFRHRNPMRHSVVVARSSVMAAKDFCLKGETKDAPRQA